MGISKKTFYLFLSIFLITIISISFFRFKSLSYTQNIILKNVAQTQASKLVTMLEFNKERLEHLSKDWGNWVDSYLFLEGKNENFIKNNFLGDTTLSDIDVDYMLFFDKNKRLFYARVKEGKIGKELVSLPKTFENLKDKINLKTSSSLYYVYDNQIYMIAFCPIIKEIDEPSNGILVIVNKINKKFFEKNKIKDIKIKIENKNVKSFDKLNDFSHYYYSFNHKAEILHTQVVCDFSIDKQIIFTYTSNQKDIITVLNHTSYKVFLGVILILGLVFFIFYSVIINKRVKKLDELSKTLTSKDIDFDELPSFEDEELQKVVDSVKSMAHEIIDQKNTFEGLVKNMPSGVILYSPTFIYANKYALRVLKTDMDTLSSLTPFDVLDKDKYTKEEIIKFEQILEERIKIGGNARTYEAFLKIDSHKLKVYAISDSMVYKGKRVGIVSFVDITEIEELGRELNLLMSYSPVVIYHTVYHKDKMTLKYLSDGFNKITGYKKEEVYSTWWEEHLHPLKKDEVLKNQINLESKGKLNQIYKLRKKDGSYIYINDKTYKLNKANEDNELIGFWHDVTKDEALKRVGIALSQINQMLLHVQSKEEIFEKICSILVKSGPFKFAWLGSCDFEKGVLREVSKYGEEEGYLDDFVLTLDPSNLKGTSAKCIFEGKTLSYNQNTFTNEDIEPWRQRLLEAKFFSSSSLVINDNKTSKKYILNLYSDTSNIYSKELENLLETISKNVEFALESLRNIEKLKFLSYHDPLCKLPNINALQVELNNAKEPVSICVLNIRDFSLINLNYGYKFGDKALCSISKAIKDSIAKTDKLFRLGGDKFAILLYNVHKELAIEILTRIKKKLASGISIDDEHLVPIYVRMSVVSAPEDTTEIKSMHELGMSALGYGRESKHVILFEPWMLDLSRTRISIEKNIIDAIKNESFEVYYQPIYGANDEKVYHLEALMRLKDKDGHPISPELIAKTAEEFGTINDITKVIVKKVLQQQSIWREKGIDLRVAINISALDISDENFFSMLEENLIKNKIGSDAVSLEITERAAINDLEVASRFISRARDLGIKIEIDDFGIAHSSLSEISSIDFDYLKIDKSFIDKINLSKKSEKVIEFIIFLSKEFGAKTIAEGVETKEQVDWLRKAGCDFIQGYFYSKPLPPNEIEKKL
jgi:diguanylate cyclase (GGDEF)-like protein/PAS domain S-box-containing protein